MRRLGAAAAVLLAVAAAARADVLDELSKRATTLEVQANELSGALRPASGQATPDAAERRLVEAEVAYRMGNYADATMLLYDLVEKYPKSRIYREAVFFLADSLFQRGDSLTARDYFHKIIDEFGEGAPHYQEALERLIELTIRLEDPARIVDYLARLDRIPAASRLPSAPYVRGKYLYHTGRFDQALRELTAIDKGPYAFQAKYFVGACYVAEGDLAGAAKVYHDLIKLVPATDEEKRVVELAHLALGRLHYERDEPSEAIDHYLMIPRRSELFDDALYEVAWVYVKAKRFDKALRALELLSLANAKTAMQPDVRILEGNLRIRKAQAINAGGEGNGLEEYSKAADVFQQTLDTYEKPKVDLDQLIAARTDARVFFRELTDQSGGLFEVQVAVPAVVLEMLKEEPDIKRVVNLSRDLQEIRQDLDESSRILERLERAVNSPSKVSIFPDLADRRGKGQELAAAGLTLRQQLATHERALVYRYVTPAEQGQLGQLSDRRRLLSERLAALPHSGDTYLDRVQKAHAAYDALDKKAQELDVTITSIEAELVALEKYHHDVPQTQKLPAPLYDQQARELRANLTSLRAELDAIRQDSAMASDEAGIGDELSREEDDVRAQLSGALREEHQFMARVSQRAAGDDRARGVKIAAVVAQVDHVDLVLADVNGRIEQRVDAQLADIRTSIRVEKGRVAEYRQTLAEYTSEDAEVGSDVVAGSFENVSRKLYGVAIRANVGLLDVAWSQKEQAQQTDDRLHLDFAHEKNILDGAYHEVQRLAPGTGGDSAKP